MSHAEFNHCPNATAVDSLSRVRFARPKGTSTGINPAMLRRYGILRDRNRPKNALRVAWRKICLGHYAQAYRMLEHARRCNQDPLIRGQALLCSGICGRRIGSPHTLEYLLQATVLLEGVEQTEASALTTTATLRAQLELAEYHLDAGRLHQAAQRAEAARNDALAVQDTARGARAAAILGVCHARLGKLGQAQVLLEIACNEAQTHAHDESFGWASVHLANVLMWRERFIEATAALLNAEKSFSGHSGFRGRMRLRICAALLLHLQGRRRRAFERIEQVVSALRATEELDLLAAAQGVRGRIRAVWASRDAQNDFAASAETFANLGARYLEAACRVESHCLQEDPNPNVLRSFPLPDWPLLFARAHAHLDPAATSANATHRILRQANDEGNRGALHLLAGGDEVSSIHTQNLRAKTF